MAHTTLRPPRWVLSVALLAAVVTFGWTMLTGGPELNARFRYSDTVRQLFAAGEWSSVVDVSREMIKEIDEARAEAAASADLSPDPSSDPSPDLSPGGAARGRAESPAPRAISVARPLEAAFFLAMGLDRRGFEGDSAEAMAVWTDMLGEALNVVDAPPGTIDSRDRDAGRYFAGTALARLGEAESAEAVWRDAIASYLDRVRVDPQTGDFYVLSNLFALVGDRYDALRAWYLAVRDGGFTPTWPDADPDLDELRRDPMFDLVQSSADGGMRGMVRDLYVAASDQEDFSTLLEIIDMHLRFQPLDAEVRLFHGFALEASCEDASGAWRALHEVASLLAEADLRAERRRARDEAQRAAARSDARAADVAATSGAATDEALARSPADASEGAIAVQSAEPEPIAIPTDAQEALDAGIAIRTLYHLAWAERGLGRLEVSEAMFDVLAERDLAARPRGSLAWFNTACNLALAGRNDEAIDALRQASRTGRRFGIAWARVDPDLDPIRDDPRFAEALERPAPRPLDPGSQPFGPETLPFEPAPQPSSESAPGPSPQPERG